MYNYIPNTYGEQCLAFISIGSIAHFLPHMVQKFLIHNSDREKTRHWRTFGEKNFLGTDLVKRAMEMQLL